MFLIAGLGNIGKRYEYNRHNLGFLVIDGLTAKYKLNKQISKLGGSIFKGNISNQSILFVQPNTMMNLSGISIQKIKNFYHI